MGQCLIEQPMLCEPARIAKIEGLTAKIAFRLKMLALEAEKFRSCKTYADPKILKEFNELLGIKEQPRE